MTSVYAEPFTAKQLYDEITCRLNYGIDLSHLKKSKYILKDTAENKV